MVTIRVQTRLLNHWAQIALAQEWLAHEARGELVRRRSEALRTGAGLDLELELRPSMIAAAASASAVDALYGEVREMCGATQEMRARWRASGTPRFAQIYETLCRGFVAESQWRDDLKWLFQSQRDAALHPLTSFGTPQPHPLGVETSGEYVVYRCENATRTVDIMLDILEGCASRPRDALREWVDDSRM